PRVWQRLYQLILRCFDIVYGFESFQVLRSDSGEDANLGVHEIGKLTNHAATICPHLNDKYLVLGLELIIDDPTDAHQRIETLRCLERAIALAQKRVQKVLGRSLAVAASNTNHDRTKLTQASLRREEIKRIDGVLYRSE